jgi:hypothetical protein
VSFQSPVAYTDPQALTKEASAESPDDYGREFDPEEPFEDEPGEEG